MSLIVDGSKNLAWYFGDERVAASIAVLNQVADAGAVVPAPRKKNPAGYPARPPALSTLA